MKLVLVGAAASPTAVNWARTVAPMFDRVVFLASSPVKSSVVLPDNVEVCTVPSPRNAASARTRRSHLRRGEVLPSDVAIGARALRAAEFSSLPFSAATIWKTVRSINPDVVHALRIPFEAMAAALFPSPSPLVTSVWGNDFTLYARNSVPLTYLTRRVMRRTAGLFADCERDRRLAPEFGLNPAAPTAIVPGSGGLDTDVFNASAGRTDVVHRLGLDVDAPIVVNPRGRRGYVLVDEFFDAIPRVLAVHPTSQFVGIGLAGDRSAEQAASRHGRGHVILTGPLSANEMADVFAVSDVTISLSTHDGTPNSLLEAMACGSVPVVTSVPSVEETVQHGRTGFVVPSGDAETVADALTSVLGAGTLRAQIAKRNVERMQSLSRAAMYGVIENLYLDVVRAVRKR